MQQSINPRLLSWHAQRIVYLRQWPAWQMAVHAFFFRWRVHLALVAGTAFIAFALPGWAGVLLVLVGHYTYHAFDGYRRQRDWRYVELLVDWQKTESLAKDFARCEAEICKGSHTLHK